MREGNVLSSVCLSVCPLGVGRGPRMTITHDTYTGPQHRDIPSPDMLLNLNLTVQEFPGPGAALPLYMNFPPPRPQHPPPCMTSYWNAFLFYGFSQVTANLDYRSLLGQNIITGRNEVVAKVIFLHLSVILFTGGGVSASVHAGIPPPPGSRPPWEQTPPGSRHPPGADPPGSRHPPRSRLQHTVYERPVRILLECILVSKNISYVQNKEKEWKFGSDKIAYYGKLNYSTESTYVCRRIPCSDTS